MKGFFCSELMDRYTVKVGGSSNLHLVIVCTWFFQCLSYFIAPIVKQFSAIYSVRLNPILTFPCAVYPCSGAKVLELQTNLETVM